ncbi:uncharacterized protein BX663DRAFT_501910 [Cokeromyces recurvatus]|uniref:uncharacterized protein n=1 Tax=Cokeromyces recurvatus TaxID=90255 RepID=UPI002220F897|nr:uncharacterized protein BX663DRAFT_501910 [Cokeromyces recurvatus]KAI7905150.1 hypothetical protein BX663DRAFT_501910 [Cokeromyces recurvatus]
MEPQDRNQDRIKMDADDFLSIQNQLKAASIELINEAVPGRTLESKNTSNLVKHIMGEWLGNICNALSENIEFEGGEAVDTQALFSLSEPIDERLKAKVNEKELELNNMIEKVIKLRTQTPEVLSNLVNDACRTQSQYAEQLEIQPALIDMDVDEPSSIPLEEAKKEYNDSIRLISILSETVPTELERVQRIEELTQLSERK